MKCANASSKPEASQQDHLVQCQLVTVVPTQASELQDLHTDLSHVRSQRWICNNFEIKHGIQTLDSNCWKAFISNCLTVEENRITVRGSSLISYTCAPILYLHCTMYPSKHKKASEIVCRLSAVVSVNTMMHQYWVQHIVTCTPIARQ
jgi:hypothetical protein